MRKATLNHLAINILFLLLLLYNPFRVIAQEAIAFWPISGDTLAVVNGNISASALDYRETGYDIREYVDIAVADQYTPKPNYNYIELSIIPNRGNTYTINELTYLLNTNTKYGCKVDFIYSFSPDFSEYEVIETVIVYKTDGIKKISGLNVTIPEGDTLFMKLCPYHPVSIVERVQLNELTIKGYTTPYTPPASLQYNNVAWCIGEDIALAEYSGPEGGTFSSGPGLIIDPVTGAVDITASIPGSYTVSYILSEEVIASTDIKINSKPVCIISGPDERVCPLSATTFTAPEGLLEYSWSVSGDAAIIGDSDAPTVQVETGESCESAFTLSLTVTDENGCTASCSREVLTGAPEPVALTVPGNYSAIAYLPQESINDQFDEWLSQAVFQGGCNSILTSSPAAGELIPPDACGGSITVTWTVISDCSPPVEKSSTFTVPDATPVALTVPGNFTVETSCLPQTSIELMFAEWLSKVKVEGGCNTKLTTSPAPDEMIVPDACGGNITVTWTATSDCQEVIEKSATFTVPGITLPVSIYDFAFDAPDDICSNNPILVPVTFKTISSGDAGYEGVRFKIDASGPGDATFKAFDTDGTTYTFSNSGYWGPAAGFILPADYQETTDLEIIFSDPGTYSITLSLVDALSDETIGNLSETVSLVAGQIPYAPDYDQELNTYVCDGTLKTARVITGENEEVIWYSTESGTETTVAPSASGAGIYTAWAEAKNLISGCVSPFRTEVKLILQSSGPAVITGTQAICAGETATLTVSLPGVAPWTFTWTDGINDYVVNETYDPFHKLTVSPSVSTTYTLSGFITDGSGSSFTGTGEAKIYTGPVTSVPHFMACRNTSIRIPVTVKSFREVRDISLTLKYDDNVMKYTGFENGAISFGEGEIKINDVPYNDNFHLLRISKIAQDENLPALTDDEVLLWLKFDYTTGYSALEWIDSPDDSWCSYSYYNDSDNPDFETEEFCDFPEEAYYINGSVSSYPIPDVHIVFNGIVAGYDESFTYCSDEMINVTLEAVEGTAPYIISWTVNDGDEQSAILEDGDALFNGTLAAGTHVLQLTSLTDVHGCQLADVSGYKTTLTINEEPDVFFTLDGNDLLPFDVVSYCTDTPEMPLALVDNQEGKFAKGLAPFSFSFAINNGGTSGSFEDVGFGAVADLANYLPKDQYGEPLAGTYNIEITSFTDANGCRVSQDALAYYTFSLVVEPRPELVLDINNATFVPGSVEPFCYDEYAIDLKIAEPQGEVPVAGNAPFNFSYRINGGEEIAMTNVDYNTVVDVLQYLPSDQVSGGVTSGDYVIQITHFSDANGCSLNDEILNNHIYTIRINPRPAAIVTTEDASCIGTFSGSVSFEPEDVAASYRYTLEPGGHISGGQTGVYSFVGLAAGSYTWTMTDLTTSCVSSGDVTIGEPDAISLIGTIRYFNDSGTPLNDVSVSLIESETKAVIATVYTNSGGAYAFDQVCPGLYDVEIKILKPVFSINSTDAGQVNAWNISQSGNSWPSIEKVRYLTGDVNGDDYVNSGDAAMIQNYFLTLGMEVDFDNAWEFWKINERVTVQPQINKLLQIEIPAGSSGVIQDFYGMGSGDFNRSFIPSDETSEPLFMKSAQVTAATVSLLRGDEQVVDAGEVIELPVRAMQPMKVGAISLILDYPDTNLEVENVFLQDNHEQAAGFNTVNNMLIIGWNSVNPVSVEAGEPLLTIRLKASAEAMQVPLYFELAPNPLNELADENLLAIEDASLVMDGLFVKETVTGNEIIEPSPSFMLDCYPNPFGNQVTIKYSLPESGYVNLTVTGITGNRIEVLPDEFKAQGEYSFNLNAMSLMPGIYHVALRYTSQSGQSLVKTVRIVKK